MAKTVVGSFDTFEHARDVVDALERSGRVAHGDVNLVAHDTSRRWTGGVSDATAPDSTLRSSGTSTSGLAASGVSPMTGRTGDATSEGGTTDGGTASGAASGALVGGAIGGTAGLLAGLAGLAIPGIGPLVAAGPIAAALAGAGVGAVAGGLIGGLTHVGVSDTDAEYYAESVRRGGALVVVKAQDDDAQHVADLMRSHGAVDIESRVAAWKQSGWTGFDDKAGEWDASRIESERQVWRSTPAGAVRVPDEGGDFRTTGSGSTLVGGTTGGSGPGRDATIGGSTVGTGRGRDLGAGGTTTGSGLGGSTIGGSTADLGGPPGGGTFGGTTGTTGLAGGQVGSGGGLGTSAGSGTTASRTGVGSEHPNLGASPDKPGIDTRARDHASTGRAGAAASSVKDGLKRASDAVERRIPGDSDGDGR